MAGSHEKSASIGIRMILRIGEPVTSCGSRSMELVSNNSFYWCGGGAALSDLVLSTSFMYSVRVGNGYNV